MQLAAAVRPCGLGLGRVRLERRMSARTAAATRKQAEKREVNPSTAAPVLPADAHAVAALSKSELQAQLGQRGLDTHGKKDELVGRLLDELVSQESAISASAPRSDAVQPGLAGEPSTLARRGRRTSRKATASADPLPQPAPTEAAGLDDAKPVRRGRRTSRRISEAAAPAEVLAAEAAMPAAAAEVAPASARRPRRTSRKTTAVEPLPAGAEVASEQAEAAAPRTRRASRRSSALEPSELAEAAATTEAEAAPAAHRGRRTSSTKSASSVGVPPSRAKLLAKSLAQKEIALHGSHAAATAATVAAAAAPAAAAPLAAEADSADHVYAGAYAQSGGLILAGAEQVTPGASFMASSAEQAAAQLAGAAGAVDEPGLGMQGPSLLDIAAAADVKPMLRMASLVETPAAGAEASSPDDALSAFDRLTLPPSAGAADAAASAAQAAAAAPTEAEQHPSLRDCVAAVEEPLVAAAAAPAEDEAPDEVLSAFDHMLAPSAAAAVAAPESVEAAQHPSIQDCMAAAEDQTDSPGASGEDEEADEALSAFDHMQLEQPTGAADAAPVAEVLPTPVLASSAVSNSADLSALLANWVASIRQLFEDWSRKLSGGTK